MGLAEVYAGNTAIRGAADARRTASYIAGNNRVVDNFLKSLAIKQEVQLKQQQLNLTKRQLDIEERMQGMNYDLALGKQAIQGQNNELMASEAKNKNILAQMNLDATNELIRLKHVGDARQTRDDIAAERTLEKERHVKLMGDSIIQSYEKTPGNIHKLNAVINSLESLPNGELKDNFVRHAGTLGAGMVVPVIGPLENIHFNTILESEGVKLVRDQTADNPTRQYEMDGKTFTVYPENARGDKSEWNAIWDEGSGMYNRPVEMRYTANAIDHFAKMNKNTTNSHVSVRNAIDSFRRGTGMSIEELAAVNMENEDQFQTLARAMTNWQFEFGQGNAGGVQATMGNVVDILNPAQPLPTRGAARDQTFAGPSIFVPELTPGNNNANIENRNIQQALGNRQKGGINTGTLADIMAANNAVDPDSQEPLPKYTPIFGPSSKKMSESPPQAFSKEPTLGHGIVKAQNEYLLQTQNLVDKNGNLKPNKGASLENESNFILVEQSVGVLNDWFQSELSRINNLLNTTESLSEKQRHFSNIMSINTILQVDMPHLIKNATARTQNLTELAKGPNGEYVGVLHYDRGITEGSIFSVIDQESIGASIDRLKQLTRNSGRKPNANIQVELGDKTKPNVFWPNTGEDAGRKMPWKPISSGEFSRDGKNTGFVGIPLRLRAGEETVRQTGTPRGGTARRIKRRLHGVSGSTPQSAGKGGAVAGGRLNPSFLKWIERGK